MKVLLVENADDVCGGVITGSGGTRFCLRASNICSVKGHLVKVPLRDNTFYIKHTRANQAKVSPSLRASLLPRDMTPEKLLAAEHTVDIWTTYFWGCQSFVNRDSDDLSTIATTTREVPSLGDLTHTKMEFATPARVTINSLLSEAVPLSPQGEVTLLPMIRLLELGEDESGATTQLAHVIDEWNTVLQNISILDNAMRSRATKEAEYRDSLHEHFTQAMNVLDGNTNRIQILSGQLGDFTSLSDEGKTVVDALLELCEAIQQIDELAIKASTFESKVKDEWAKSEEFTTSIRSSFRNVAESFADFKAQYHSDKTSDMASVLKDDLQDVRAELRTLDQKLCGKELLTSPSDSNIQDDLAKLKNEVHSLENYVRYRDVGAIQRSIIPESPKELENGSGSGDSEAEARDWDSVDKRLNEVESRVSTEGFVGGGVTFSSQADVEIWVGTNGKPSSGFFWDIFSVLCAMKPKYLTSKERSDWKFSTERIHSTLLEAELTTAMAHLLPPALYATNKAGDLSEKDDGFGACLTHDEWVGGHKRKAFVDKTGSLLDTFCGSVEKAVNHKKNKLDSKARRLAVSLLDKTRSHWNALTRFVESYHTKLTKVSQFPMGKAWPLIGQCVGAIFEAMWAYRSQVDKLQDNQDPEEIASVIWAVLQCHRIMEDFIRVDFHGHPAVVKEITHFMITNRIDPSVVDVIATELKEVKTQNKQLRDKLKAHKEKSAQLNRKLENLVQTVDILKKKIK